MAGRYPSRRCCTSFICLRFRERNLHERRRRRPSSGREKIFVLAQLISRCWRSKGEILIEREREWERTPTSSGLLFFSVSVRPSLQSVWPDLAKFQHFGKNFIVYGNFLVWFFVWYLANFCTRKFMPMGKFSMIQAPKDWKIRWPPSHTGCSLLVWELSSCVMASPVCRRIGQRMQ